MLIINKKYLFSVTVFCLVVATATAEAKVYIWTDENEKTHYCNELDDVPKKYKEKCKVIESKASSGRTSKGDTGHIDVAIQNLRTRAKALNKEMLNLRRQGVRSDSTQYVNLREEYIAVQRQIRQLYSQKSTNKKTKRK